MVGNLPHTCTVMLEWVLLSIPLCELWPVQMYSPLWAGKDAFVIESLELMFPGVKLKSPNSGMSTRKSVTLSLCGNGAGDPCSSHEMVGMGVPVDVQEMSTEPPSCTVTVVVCWDTVLGGSASVASSTTIDHFHKSLMAQISNTLVI